MRAAMIQNAVFFISISCVYAAVELFEGFDILAVKAVLLISYLIKIQKI
jgi:hypothetical protein